MPRKKKITLSICIPAYNEELNLATIVKKVLKVNFTQPTQLEIIIVDDQSSDGTLAIAKKLAEEHSNIQVIENQTNLGKSQTVKRAMLSISQYSDYVVCQDADLEYDPQDLAYMLDRLVTDNYDVAYGNRFGHYTEVLYKKNFYGNLLLSLFSAMFTTPRIKVLIPDMEVCYKMMRTEVARAVVPSIRSKSNFGIEPELTAKLSKLKVNGRGLKFVITPASYNPRSIEEGKKMRAFKDGTKAFFQIIAYNTFNFK